MRRSLKVAAIAASIAATLVCSASVAARARAGAEEARKGWEYRAASLAEDLAGVKAGLDGKRRYESVEAALDLLGKDGWEICHAAGDFFIFKRPRSRT